MNLLNKKLFVISISACVLGILIYYLDGSSITTNPGKVFSWISGTVALVSFIIFFVKESLQILLFKISVSYYITAVIILFLTKPDTGDFFSFGSIFQDIIIIFSILIYLIICISVSIFKSYKFSKNTTLF